MWASVAHVMEELRKLTVESEGAQSEAIARSCHHGRDQGKRCARAQRQITSRRPEPHQKRTLWSSWTQGKYVADGGDRSEGERGRRHCCSPPVSCQRLPLGFSSWNPADTGG